MTTPIEILRGATRAVPAVKYALGIGGVIAAVALIYSFKIDPRAAFVGAIIMLVLMAVLVIFARMSTLAAKKLALPALVFTWFTLLLFMAVAIALFTSVFLKKPLDLQSWLTGNMSANRTNESDPNMPPAKRKPATNEKDSLLIYEDSGGAFYVDDYEVNGNRVRVKVRVTGKPHRSVSWANFSDILEQKMAMHLKKKLGDRAPALSGVGSVGIINLGDVTGHLALFPAVFDDIEVAIVNRVAPISSGGGAFRIYRTEVNRVGLLKVWLEAIGRPEPLLTKEGLEEAIRKRGNEKLKGLLSPDENLVQNAISEVSIQNMWELKGLVK
jgi:hypothetical protein